MDVNGTIDFLRWDGTSLCAAFGWMVSPRESNRAPREEYTAYIKCCAYAACQSVGADRVTVMMLCYKSEEGKTVVAENAECEKAILKIASGDRKSVV